MKIAPYEDEKEGFALPYPRAKASTALTTNAPSRAESPTRTPENGSDKDYEKEDTEQDAENVAAAAPAVEAEDPNIVTWSGPNDQDNPQNWSSFKKLFTFGQICLLTFTSKYYCRVMMFRL